MNLGDSEWSRLSLALLILPAIVLYKCALWLWRTYILAMEGNRKRSMDEECKGSSVDPPGLEVKEVGSKQVLQQLKVKVELIHGKCRVENGDPKISAKCNAVLAEMNAFQREFLTNAPEGKPNKMVFTEVVLQDENGCVERRAYFESEKEKESLAKRAWKKIKSIGPNSD